MFEYLAGRNPELDRIIDWIEGQGDEISHENLGNGSATYCASLAEILRQLWALLGPLVAGDAGVHSIFSNVQLHTWLEARKRVVEPINDDRILIVKIYFPNL